MKRFSSLLFAAVLVVACGGAKATNLDDTSDGGGGSTDGGAADAGPKPRFEDLVTCQKPGECVLDAKGCCGLSCQPDDQLVAVRRGEEQNVIAATCDQTGPVPCPKCARQIAGNIQAFCVSGKCGVVDLRKDAISSCSKDDECVLRYGTCCQSCSGGSIEQIVSIKKGNESQLETQICSGKESCDKCLPVFPPGVRARCDQATGHCYVQGT
jgi:hypothetical protein